MKSAAQLILWVRECGGDIRREACATPGYVRLRLTAGPLLRGRERRRVEAAIHRNGRDVAALLWDEQLAREGAPAGAELVRRTAEEVERLTR